MTRLVVLLAVLAVVCEPTREQLLLQCDTFCTKAGARVEGFAPGEVCRCVWPEKPCAPASSRSAVADLAASVGALDKAADNHIELLDRAIERIDRSIELIERSRAQAEATDAVLSRELDGGAR